MVHQNKQFMNGFYTISLKNGENCEIKYGRRYYDFSEGSMIFMAPEQLLTVDYDPGIAVRKVGCYAFIRIWLEKVH